MRFLPLLLFFSLYASVLARLNFSLPGGKQISWPTLSFFQQDAPYFKVKGHSIEINIFTDNKTGACTFARNLSEHVGHDLGKFEEHTIIYLDYTGSDCLFDCISSTFPFVIGFGKYLSTLGYPNPDTFLLVRHALVEFGDLGRPSVDYAAIKFGQYDGPPPDYLNFQMIDSLDSADILGTLRNAAESIIELSQEKGIWNEVFLSKPYRFLFIFYSAILLIAMLITTFKLYVGILDRVFNLNLKAVIFMLGFIAGSINLLLFGMRIFTFTFRILYNVQVIMNTLAFQSLLYLWTVFFLRLEENRIVYLFRVQIFLGVASDLFMRCMEFSILFGTTEMKERIFNILSSYVVSVIQLSTALTFLLFAVIFINKSKALQDKSPDGVEALRKLTGLAFAGFFCYLIIACLNTRFVRIELGEYAKWYAVDQSLYGLVVVVRCVSFLSIVIVRGRSPINRTLSWLEQQGKRFQGTMTSFLSRGGGERYESQLSSVHTSAVKSGVKAMK